MQNTEFETALMRRIDTKTKPQGALGRIEELAAQVARVQGRLDPQMQSCALMLFAADHGIAAEGVSAYPAAVTRQMVANFAGGGAAANVFARAGGLDLQVINAGVAGGPFGMSAVSEYSLGDGTSNFLTGPAMSEAQVQTALDIGRLLGAGGHFDAMAFGEMGIGNTSSASVVAHKLTGIALDDLVGRGTGLEDAALAHKRDVLLRAAARTGSLDVRAVLAEYGGFETVMMTGAMLGAAAARRVVLVDGFIATVAALAACTLEPQARSAMVFAHLSPEAGHAVVLNALGADPVLSLNMRLGEGSGAALAWPLLRAAVAMLNEMASFEAAGVSGPA
ncbi:nicotinate-nucleotide--dimethylbenzimidazole phosphoribosyltransferase [Puniceibacterium confluentis]|uniref:nicotinate-nucleotide--dimethylbenzimidazole phosphoribosyltransferase n=2 Tax=Puniceibacterium confluentis TaxID=1958944 RepID=UPI0011B39D23|nr:nicotinate-nucleotide--dimethylbenzimidazole phosphoribosyltransferase [Puniceibacterium confluentis]